MFIGGSLARLISCTHLEFVILPEKEVRSTFLWKSCRPYFETVSCPPGEEKLQIVRGPVRPPAASDPRAARPRRLNAEKKRFRAVPAAGGGPERKSTFPSRLIADLESRGSQIWGISGRAAKLAHPGRLLHSVYPVFRSDPSAGSLQNILVSRKSSHK